jgi:hypothetical protein
MVKKLDKNQLAEKIDKILASHQRPYEKKIALFNLVKNLDVGDTEPDKKKRINCLLEGQIHGEIARQCMEEYKKITAESFNNKAKAE